MTASPRTVVVVGGGMSGLAAAHALRGLANVIVLEASGRVGGKLRVSDVGGVPVDEGADALLRRVPDAVALAAQVGLGNDLVSPASGEAFVRSRGRLRPLPVGTLLGVPGDLAALARSEVLSAAALARVPVDLIARGAVTVEDVSVGEIVTRRLGREVVERLVDPLLGGVYAGRADQLSLQATLPPLAAALTRQRSLVLAVREARVATVEGPVFAGLPGGLGRLPAAVATASGAEVRVATTVRDLHRTAAGWRVVTGSAASPSYVDADAVIVAVPAAPAARLLRDVAPAAAAELAGIDYASVAIVTLVLAGSAPGRGSGYLIPAVEGLTTKAVTFTSRKWDWYAGDVTVVRASVGRYGEEIDLQRDDDELTALVHRELELVVGPAGRLLDSRVTRWGGGLPQYAVGHLDRVRRIRAALPAGLAVAGAAYDGVGVPAVIRSGTGAAAVVLPHNGRHDGHPA
ncbi:MAG: protoporphyrinogen/coproporphyrinogen oxidase [Actinomycetota bacterium]|nr:protoporphyrinogen/coproporphyrinogen oxidase [Actinomycetota bacterium]